MKAISIAHIFYDINMSYSHQGLTEILAKKLKKDEPDAGEIVLFINSAWTACKLLAPGNSFLYHRSTDAALTFEDIKRLPQSFGAEAMRFSAALAKELLKKFKEKEAA